MAAIPKQTVESKDGVWTVVSYRDVNGRLVRCEYVDRSRCYTSGEWIVADVFDGTTWQRVTSRGTVPTSSASSRADFELWMAEEAMSDLLDEAETILSYGAGT